MPTINDLPDVTGLQKLTATLVESAKLSFPELPSDTSPESLYIIGSYGADSATEDSDIDILVGITAQTQIPKDALETIEDYMNGNSGGLPTKMEFFVRLEDDVCSTITTACGEKGYDTVYNIRTESFEQVP